jgi:hypothetical protein
MENRDFHATDDSRIKLACGILLKGEKRIIFITKDPLCNKNMSKNDPIFLSGG